MNWCIEIIIVFDLLLLLGYDDFKKMIEGFVVEVTDG